MKRFVTITVALLLVMMSSAVALTDAQRADLTAQLPEEVTLLSEETDDGNLEVAFASADGLREYEFTLAADGTVLKLSYDLRNDRGGAARRLTDDELCALLLKDYPDAEITAITPKTDDGLYETDVSFTAATLYGTYTFNAEDGTVMDYELCYALTDVPGGAEVAAIIEGAYPGATVTEFERDDDDDAELYEGEALLDGQRYELKINVQTGEIIKWKLDD